MSGFLEAGKTYIATKDTILFGYYSFVTLEKGNIIVVNKHEYCDELLDVEYGVNVIEIGLAHKSDDYEELL